MNDIKFQDWVKFDLHQHTINEKPCIKQKKVSLYTHKLFFDLLKSQGVNLKAVTNHNVLDIIDHIKYALICKKLGISYLPGVEIDYNFSKDKSDENRFHAITILNPSNDIIKFAEDLDNIVKNKENSKICLNLDEFANLHNNIEFIFIPHAVKTQGLMPSKDKKLEDELDWVTDVITNGYAFPVLFENTKDTFKYSLYNELESRKASENIHFTIPTYLGSDSLFDNDLKRKANSLERVKYYFNGLSTYRGLELAIRNNNTRIAHEEMIIKRDNYIKSIKFNKNDCFNMEGQQIQLSPYLNVIIGGSGSGKTLLLNEIFRSVNYENKDLSVCSAFAKKGKSAYEKKIGKDPLIEIDYERIDINHKLRTFEVPNIFDEIVKYTNDIVEVGKLFNINNHEKMNSNILEFINNCTNYKEILNESDKNKEIIVESLEKLQQNINFININKITENTFDLNTRVYDSTNLDSLKKDIDEISNILIEKHNMLEYFNKIQRFLNNNEDIINLIKLYNSVIIKLDDIQLNKKNEVKRLMIQKSIYRIINYSISKSIEEIGGKIAAYKLNETNAKKAISLISLNIKSYIKNKKKMNNYCIKFPYKEILESIQNFNGNDVARYSLKLKEDELKTINIEDTFLINRKGNITKIQKVQKELKAINGRETINFLDSNEMKDFVSKVSENGLDLNNIISMDFPLALEFKVENKWVPVEEINPGTIAKIAIRYFFETSIKKDEPNIIFIDQPENDVDKEFITNVLSKFLINNKNTHQIFITTHDPILAINGDANVIIESYLDGNRKINYRSFPLEFESTLLVGANEVAKILDGGKQNIKDRYQKYGGIIKYDYKY